MANDNSIYIIEKSKIGIKAIFKYWWVVLLAGIIGLIAGIIYAKKQPIFFESYLAFSLDDNANVNAGGIASLAAQFGLGGSEKSMFSGDNIVEIIKSRNIIERVLLSAEKIHGKQTTLINYYIELEQRKKKTDGQKIKFEIGISKEKFNYAQDSLLYSVYQDIIKNALNAGRPDKQLNIYFLKFKSIDEAFTKIFTDKVLSETINFYTELKTKKSEATLKVLEDRVAFIKGNMNATISNKASTLDANINPAFAAAQVPLQKQQLNMQVYSGAYEELYKNLELARFQFLQNIPLLQIISNNDFPMVKTKVSTIKSGIVAALISCLIISFIVMLFSMYKIKS